MKKYEEKKIEGTSLFITSRNNVNKKRVKEVKKTRRNKIKYRKDPVLKPKEIS